MVDFFNIHAESIVLIVLITLAVFSGFVFFGAIYSRWLLNRNERRRTEIRARLSDLVIRYASEDLSYTEIKESFQAKADYIILLEVVNELDKVLEGKEEERLKRLLNLKPIRDFFIDRYDTGGTLDRARACLYFSRQKNIKSNLVPRFVTETASRFPTLAYSAGMAVMVHGNSVQKKDVIHNLLSNAGVSNQAMNDIFKTFQTHSIDSGRDESELLMQLIDERIYTPERTALLIRTLGELGFYESADFLMKEFCEVDPKNHDRLITEALIRVITAFGMAEIQKRLRQDYVPSPYRNVREAVAVALGIFPDKENIPFLKWLLVDSDFYVRYHAAKSLFTGHGISLDTLNIPIEDKEDWLELMGEIEDLTEKEAGL